MYARPWKIRDPKSGAHAGIGAFNLVRASSYRAMGGHVAIAMRPDDDMKLAKLVKLRGCRSDFVFGKGMLFVEWYATWRELAAGMEKNMFAGIGYNVAAVVAASVAQLLL